MSRFRFCFCKHTLLAPGKFFMLGRLVGWVEGHVDGGEVGSA